MGFYNELTCEDLTNYLNAVTSVCADYVEIDSRMASLMPKQYDSSRFILHIDDVSDFSLLKEHEFAFVVAPVSMIPIVQRMHRDNIIIEIEAGDRELLSLYSDIRTISKTLCACGVRIVKQFGDDTEHIREFISYCKRRFGLFIDICPTNENMNGLSAAIECFYSNAEMLSLAFCTQDTYTPLECFAAYIDQFGRNPESKPLIPEILKAANCVSDFSIYFALCLKNLGDIMFGNYFDVPENADIEHKYQKRPEAKKSNIDLDKLTSAQKQFFRDMDIEKDAYEKLREIIDDAEPDIFNHLIFKDYIKS